MRLVRGSLRELLEHCVVVRLSGVQSARGDREEEAQAPLVPLGRHGGELRLPLGEHPRRAVVDAGRVAALPLIRRVGVLAFGVLRGPRLRGLVGGCDCRRRPRRASAAREAADDLSDHHGLRAAGQGDDVKRANLKRLREVVQHPLRDEHAPPLVEFGEALQRHRVRDRAADDVERLDRVVSRVTDERATRCEADAGVEGEGRGLRGHPRVRLGRVGRVRKLHQRSAG
mmetsp:Transcript_22404/g.69503  ORF Transcript_22404/g.69503 Transcript_22404/m.69503 type:complete len:228 (+) Transcript_22404:1306-1989(+)